MEPNRRTFPLPGWLSELYQVDFAEQGFPEAGIMLRLQTQKGFRPGKFLKITREDILGVDFDGGQGGPGFHGNTLIRPNKTKRGREEVVALAPTDDPLTNRLLFNLARKTPPGVPLARVSAAQYRDLFLASNRRLGVPFPIRPHSPRAGYATDGVGRGLSIPDLMRSGRWGKEEVFRAYVDQVTALSISVGSLAATHGAAVERNRPIFAAFFAGFA